MMLVFFFKQKTAYEMRISDWSSDVCSSDLVAQPVEHEDRAFEAAQLAHREGQSVLSRIGGQAAKLRRSGGGVGAYRCGEPQQFIPMRRNMTQSARFGRHAGKQGAGSMAGTEGQKTLLDVNRKRDEWGERVSDSGN